MGYSNAKQKITYEAYLQMEAISDIRREFYYGEILAMDGGTPIHNILVQNTSQTIRGKIQRKGCQTFTENVRLELEAEGYYVYPDVMLVCNESEWKQNLSLKSAELIVEVLSDSTLQDDKGQKLASYLKIPSLSYYLLVSQKETRVEVYEKIEKGWKFNLYESAKEEIPLGLLGFSLSVEELYKGISFES
ncbi:MAG: Uma2 family endonuclease [Bacteroidota bacterium]